MANNSFEEKYQFALDELSSSLIEARYYLPLSHRLMRAFCLKVRPPHYRSGIRHVIIALAWFGMLLVIINTVYYLATSNVPRFDAINVSLLLFVSMLFPVAYLDQARANKLSFWRELGIDTQSPPN